MRAPTATTTEQQLDASNRQNEIQNAGWNMLRFTNQQVQTKAGECQQQVEHALAEGPRATTGTVRSGTCLSGTAPVAILWLWSDPAVADTAINTMSCSEFQNSAIIGGSYLAGGHRRRGIGSATQTTRGGNLLSCG